MRRRIDQWRAAVWETDLSPTTKLVALAVSQFMDFDTLGSAHPGNPRLVSMTGLSGRQIIRELQRLERAGWLKCVHRGGGRGHASMYKGQLKGVTQSPFNGRKGDTERDKGCQGVTPPSQTSDSVARSRLAPSPRNDRGQVDEDEAQSLEGRVDRIWEDLVSVEMDDGWSDDDSPYLGAWERQLTLTGYYHDNGSGNTSMTRSQIRATAKACDQLDDWFGGQRLEWMPKRSRGPWANGKNP
jgi:hypothetical protein